MPLTDALILSAICVAFVGFGVLLAWGDSQTRNLKRADRLSGDKAVPQNQRRVVSVVGNARERQVAHH